MEFPSIVNILVSVVFRFATSGIPTAFGNAAESRISIPNCNHDQLYAEGAKMFKCESDHIQQYLVVMSENYKNGAFDLQEACKIHNEIGLEQGRNCPLNFVNACLPGYYIDVINNFYDALRLDCNHPTPYFNSTLINQNELQALVSDLKDDCKNEPLCSFRFFKFDKQCPDAERLESIYKVGDCSFWTLVFGLQSDATEKHLSFKKGGKGDPEFCKTLSYMLDVCFKENECFSQREMGMARDLVAAAYKTVMEPFAMIANEFGSLTDFMEFVNNDVTLKWNDHTITLPNSFVREVLRYVEELDKYILDYNTDDCELNPDNDP